MRSPFWTWLLTGHFCWMALYSISEAFALLAQPQPVNSLEEANRLFESGSHRAAEAMYRDVIEGTTNVSERGMATFNLGLLLQRLNRHAEAVAAFTNLIGQPVNDLEPSPDLMETWRNYRHRAQWEIGNCYFSRKDFSNALEAYRASNDKYPLRSWCGTCSRGETFRYEWHMGLCYDHLGKTIDALKHYYRAGLSGQHMDNAQVCFRVIGIYEQAGQMPALRRLLDEIDSRYLAHIRDLEKGSERRFSKREIEEMKPTATVRRALEMKSWAQSGKRSELIKLLKMRNTATGPPYDGNWEAIEAARLLALTPEQSVPYLIAAASGAAKQDDLWIAYALARCGGTNAVASIKGRALREEYGWALHSLAYSLSFAGQEGLAVLESVPSLRSYWEQLKREGKTPSGQSLEPPKASARLRLPERISQIE